MGRLGVWRKSAYGSLVDPVHVDEVRIRVSAVRPLWSMHHRACIDPISWRWRCAIYMATGDTATSLRRQPCNAEHYMTTHRTWRTGDIVFCIKCACYSVKCTRGLKGICTLSPHNDVGRTRLLRMKAGRHPLNDILMGRPEPYYLLDGWETLKAYDQQMG